MTVKHLDEITQAVDTTEELRELEHVIAVKGGKVLHMREKRNGPGLFVTYLMPKQSDK